ncbi:CP2 transcription factor-domain-containing protein [Gongronella butleri]|nr:CP2 transcription factor-domain-containing protein [Gongronella butleri]
MMETRTPLSYPPGKSDCGGAFVKNDFVHPPSPSFRIETILEAPTAAAQRTDEPPLTYLNKGQTYNVSLKDRLGRSESITSTIIIMFHDENHRKVAANYWRFWQTQQDNPRFARAIDIDLSKSSGIQQVECQRFDRITFKWHGHMGANVMIRFNCLSTDFSRIKGVKGIPLRLCTESAMPTGEIETAFCRIKLFRDKGAERKNKDDAKHIERQLEKLRGKNGEPHPLWLACSRALPYTLFQSLDTVVSSVVAPVSTVAPSHSPPMGATPSPTAPSMLMVPSMSQETRGYKRHPSFFHNQDASSMSPPSPQLHPTSMPFPMPSLKHYTSVPMPWLDIDPEYIPQKRNRVAKLSLYIRFDDQGLYRAIYLEELTVAHLQDRILAKMQDMEDVEIKNMIRQVANKTEVYVTMDDDAIVQDIPEEQVMTVKTRLNDDGTTSILLVY